MRVWLYKAAVPLAFIILLSSCAKPAASPTPTSSITPTKTLTATPAAPTPSSMAKGPYGELRVVMFSLGYEIFDPPLAGDATKMLTPMFDMLLRAEGAKITPGVAEKWELAPDGKAWIFHIREGIKFHNGEDLTADDVKFTIERYCAPDAINADTRRAVDRVEAVDAHTVYAYTKGAQPFYPYIIAPGPRAHGLIQPKDYIERNGAAYFKSHPMGSGAFQFIRYIAGDMVEYEAVDNHWRKTPGFKKLTIIKVPEESTRVAMLKTRQVDVIDVGTESSVELEQENYRVGATTAENALIALPGAYQPQAAAMPTGNLKVRQALSLAIDRAEINNMLFRGKAFPAGPAGVYSVSADIDIPYWMDYAAKAYRYDPEEAKRLLKEAGYPDGFTIKLWSVMGGGYSDMPRLAEVVQGYWGKIGVKAEIVPVDIAVRNNYRNILKVPDWIGTAYTHLMSPSAAVPERLQAAFSSTGSFVLLGRAFPELETMLDSALAELDPVKRKGLIDKAIKLTADAYVTLMICGMPQLVAYGPWVEFELPPPPTVSPFGYYIDTGKHK